MKAGLRNTRDSRLVLVRPQVRTHQPSAKFLHLSQLRRMRGCEQVAAVCYRVRGGSIEFLLVQTRGGRWTFPKGSAEAGLTHAQAAALEAFEEAGVHGRMEEAAFARYTRRKRGSMQNSIEIGINAHLCEVSWLGPPQEFDRNPSWFSPEKAKRRLQQDRAPDYAAELMRVVDRALARIRRSGSRTSMAEGRHKDALQKVHFTIDGSWKTTAGAKGSRASRKTG